MKLTRLLALLALFVAAGCGTENPTSVVADNGYPAIPDGGDPSTEMTVFKVWWVTSLLDDPVAPGDEGQPQRTVPDSDFAYAVIAVGWDPSSPKPPTRLIPAKTSAKLGVARGDTLHVEVSDQTFLGNCAVGRALSQDDADFITSRIFPYEFRGSYYDAPTCTSTPLLPDGGVSVSSLDGGDGAAPDGAENDALVPDGSSSEPAMPEAGAD